MDHEHKAQSTSPARGPNRKGTFLTAACPPSSPYRLLTALYRALPGLAHRPELCLIAPVLHRVVHVAPDSYRRRRQNAHAKQSTHKNRGEAHAWMEQDKANRVVEGVQIGWERVDKSKPFVFGRSNLPWGGNGTSSLNYHPEANQPGGCL